MKRLVGQRVGGVGPPADLRLASAQLEHSRSCYRVCQSCGDRLELGDNPGLGDRAPEWKQGHYLGEESVGAYRWMVVGAGNAKCPVDPVHGIGVTISDEPVPPERRDHRECAFGIALVDRPSKSRVEVVDVGVELG